MAFFAIVNTYGDTEYIERSGITHIKPGKYDTVVHHSSGVLYTKESVNHLIERLNAFDKE